MSPVRTHFYKKYLSQPCSYEIRASESARHLKTKEENCMACSRTLLFMLCSITALGGCLPGTRVDYSKNSLPLSDQFRAELRATSSCNKLPDCKPSTIFPNRTFNQQSSGAANCIEPTIAFRGRALRPENVGAEVNAAVWVALVVPAKKGYRPIEGRVTGSTDSRFEAAAYEMAMELLLTPLTCNGVGYESMVIAPYVFGSSDTHRSTGSTEAVVPSTTSQTVENR